MARRSIGDGGMSVQRSSESDFRCGLSFTRRGGVPASTGADEISVHGASSPVERRR